MRLADGLPTMVDVARAAGVSLKTVSRVVNNEPGVRAETALRVRVAIDELGFQLNDIARSLRPGQRSSTLGLVIEDLANPFYSALGRAVEEVAHRHDYLVLSGSSDEDPSRERELVRAFLGRRVDGLLIVPAGSDHSYLGPLSRFQTPAVFMDRPPGNIDADVILLDDRRGSRDAVRHLLERGHRRIAFLGDMIALYTSAERLAGYREALQAWGVTFDPNLVRTESRDAPAAESAARRLLTMDFPPTAIFAGNNRNAVGACLALHSLGAPAALIGFDDFELAGVLGVTVIADDPAAMGRQAAELIFARLAGDGGPPRRIVMPTRLIARGSGERAP